MRIPLLIRVLLRVEIEDEDGKVAEDDGEGNGSSGLEICNILEGNEDLEVDLEDEGVGTDSSKTDEGD